MAEADKVASHRMILENPDAPGTGIIVAAGDPIPAFATGYIENTPNKVDAARNMDVADAADQAAQRPNERVVQHFGLGADEAREIAERTTANRRAFDADVRAQNDPQGWLPADQAGTHLETPAADEHEGAGGEDDTPTTALADLTVPQLDKLADSLGDGKPESYKGNKADKVAALEGHVTQAQITAAAE